MQTDTPSSNFEFFAYYTHWILGRSWISPRARAGVFISHGRILVFLLARLAFFVFLSGKIGFMCIKHWEWVFFFKIYRQDFKDFVISFNAFSSSFSALRVLVWSPLCALIQKSVTNSFTSMMNMNAYNTIFDFTFCIFSLP